MRGLLIIGLVVLAACSHRPYDGERRATPPPRPTEGFTSKGGTWTDVGGGMTVIQKNGPQGRSSEVLY